MGFKWVLVLILPLLAAGADLNRYIIELSGDPIATRLSQETKRTGARPAMTSEVVRAHRQQIRKDQDQLRVSLKDLGVEVLESTEMISNSLIVRMPDDAVAKVEALPGVKRVRQAHPVKPELDHAVPLHKVPQAWNIIGVDKAGLGVKIGMIDSGIDITHPGMQDSTLQTPSGFPKTNFDTDVAFTNTKVIVARSYAALFDPVEADPSARDLQGHGTATAMAAAGALNNGPIGPIQGVAPKAYIGSYKVFGATGGGTSDIVLKAIDDAVTDGMDVISLSLSSAIAAPRLSNDIEVDAVERITGLGVVVVSSAGNKGDPNTIGSPGTAPSMITVGASDNDRVFFDGSVTVDSGTPLGGYATDEADLPATPISAALIDVSTLDQDGLACLPYPLNSFKGRIAFILRGSCTFEEKLNNVDRAGAVAAVIYTTPERNPGAMSVGTATLPALMISSADGVSVKGKLSSNPSINASLDFNLASIAASPDGVAEFSSKGPNVDGSIKPDLVATGTDFYTATEKTTPDGELYGPTGYIIVDGTSFAAPLVAGAAAILKGARPGLTAPQYRSLIINTASPITSRVQQSGAGSLNVEAAMRSTVALAPTSLSFKIGGPDPKLSQTLTLTNIGNSAESYSLSVAPRDSGPAPTLALSTVTVDPGKSVAVPVSFTATGLTAGQYEGFVKIQGTNSGIVERAPYWYAVASDVPANISVLYVNGDGGEQPLAGARLTNAIYFRVTDASGVVLPNAQPAVEVVSGGGSVTSTASLDRQYPGVFGVSVRLGTRRGDNLFRITLGNLDPIDVIITGN